MADYNEQVLRHWDQWEEETGQDSGDPNDFIDWAMAHGKLGLRPQDVRQVLRKQVTQALRQAKRYERRWWLRLSGEAVRYFVRCERGWSEALL